MATDEGVLLTSEVQSLDDFRELAMAALVRLFVVGIAGVWVLFWGLVGRLQVLQGEFLSAAVVAGLFILPAVIGIGYYLSRSFPVD